MTYLLDVAEFELKAFLGVSIVLVGYRVLTGGVNTKGLLAHKETGAFSPARLQLLLFSLIAAGAYLSSLMEAAAAGRYAFPEVPQELLLALGGSQALYLGAKGGLERMFRARSGLNKKFDPDAL